MKLSFEGGKQWIPVIEAFSFKIEMSPADITVVDVQLEIESCTGTREIFKADSVRIRPGGEIRIEADYQVRREIEGPFKAMLMAKDQEGKPLFRGNYGFGYPRYHASRDLKRVSCTATIRDDFNSSEIDEELWRIWRSNPEQFRCEQKDGRYWIHINGRVGYNGLSSKVEMITRDVVLICRSGIETPADASHPGTRNHIGWPPICFDFTNNKVSLSDISIGLYTADGKTLVDKTDVGIAFGYGLLKLKKAP